MSNIGRNINTLRKEKNMTQKELADILHVSDKVVSKWELGYSEPDIDSLLSLAEVFGISVSKLLGEDDSSSPQPKKDTNSRVKGFFKRNYMTIIQITIIYMGLIFCMASLGYYLGYDLVDEILPSGIQIVFFISSLLFAFLQTFCTLVDPGHKALTILKIVLLSLCVMFIICCFSFYGKLDGLIENDNYSYAGYFAFIGGGYIFYMVALLLNLLIDTRVIKTHAPLKFEKVFFIIVLCFLCFESGLLTANIITGSVYYSEEYYEQTTARRLSFNTSSVNFYNKGQTYKLEVVFPYQSRHDDVVYISSNEEVATVDENGLVTANKAGSCTIIARLEQNQNVRARCTINVLSPAITFIDYPGMETATEFYPTSFYCGEPVEVTCRIDDYSYFDNLDLSRFSYDFVSIEVFNENAEIDWEILEVSELQDGMFTIKFIINSAETDEIAFYIKDNLSYNTHVIGTLEFNYSQFEIYILSNTFRAGERKELNVLLMTAYKDECVYEVTSGSDIAEFIGNELYVKSTGKFEVKVTSKYGGSDSREYTVSSSVNFSPDNLKSMYYNIINQSMVINFTFDNEYAVTDKVEAVFTNDGIAEMRYENGQYVIYVLRPGSTSVTFKSHGYSTRSYSLDCSKKIA